MLSTLVVGLGRAGAELHVPVLRRARAGAAAPLFADAPIIAVDPVRRPGIAPMGIAPGDIVVVPSLTDARARLDPSRTVVHVCTPPVDRAALIEELAVLGFRDLIVEKPLAANLAELAAVGALRARHDLRVVVVAQWLSSTLTRRLGALVVSGELGTLRGISFAQHKPRFARSLATAGHPTAFDIELPHALGVVLALAGSARLVDAAGSDLRMGDTVLPRLGGARMRLAHAAGTRTELVSDLGSPIRERRIALDFDHGKATGHYPVAQDDDHARLTVEAPARATSEVFVDDSLTTFIRESYRRFLTLKGSLQEFDAKPCAKFPGAAAVTSLATPFPAMSTGLISADAVSVESDLALAHDVVRLLDEAKQFAWPAARGGEAAEPIAATATGAPAQRERVRGDVR